ncbi:hypothetical protein ACHAWF_007371 [Thalassiosira exigua]
MTRPSPLLLPLLGGAAALASGFAKSSPFLPRGGGGCGASTSPSPAASSAPSLASASAQSTASASAAKSATSGTSLSSTSSSVEADVGPALEVVSRPNWDLLSDRGKAALSRLILWDLSSGGHSQRHAYADWPEVGIEDQGKRELAEQIADLDGSYPGGLPEYLSKAQRLLKESADGTNPFESFVASVPEGESLSYEDPHANAHAGMTFAQAEEAGLAGIGDTAFVLVAGGLGERLGYGGIKLGLETNLLTNKCYLEVYAKYIQAMQRMARLKTGNDRVRIPLVIMTSDDTDPPTRQLLADHENFGFDEGQVTIVKQDKVAALSNVDAGLSLASRWVVETKPHGHGDVHHLLYRSGLVDKWVEEGRKHVVFLQDTNALVINSVLPTLGVSVAKGFHMNSICIPRLAGEAAGAIARLEHKTDPEKSLVINVEYNQLDPLLSSQGDRLGDVPDPATGYSPYPGNANNLVLELNAYAKTLAGEDRGVVVEFVNPKYKDDTRTEFKKPTRLECMMQDVPKLFQKEMGSEANIGFTTFDRWFTFSPAKNSLEAGVEDVKKGGTAPGTMSSAESDKYVQNQRKLKFAGVDVDVTQEVDLVPVAGIPVTPGPRIILCPGFAITQREVNEKISGGKITKRSSLVLEGEDLKVKNLDLDGALVIRTGHDCDVTVDGLVVRNSGYEIAEIPDGADVPEEVAIRGYTMVKHEVMEIIINKPGKYHIGADGEVRQVD